MQATSKFIPSLFVQIYSLFCISMILNAMIAYYSSLASLKQNEESIISQVAFLAQQSMIEFINGNTTLVESFVKYYGFSRIENMEADAHIVYGYGNNLTLIKIFRYQKNYGFMLEYSGNTYIAQKNFSKEFIGSDANLWILLDFFVLVLTFAIILAILHPMKILRFSLEEFTKGNYNIKVPIPKEPQLGLLAKSFNTMTIKISKLIITREFVLRNIGHELKTPLSKAKLALELMPQNPQKSIVIKCIRNLDTLVSQILTFEKVQEGENLLDKKDFFVETLILRVLETSFLQEEDLDLEISTNFKIYGDLDFLAIALKNLVENAKKYKSGGKIRVIAKESERGFILAVSNQGQRLQRDIQEYFEPFYRDKKHELIAGYGLGLSIVSRILELHNMQFMYEYQENQHIFYFLMPKLS
ncbi:ATP-binding protein [Helicobacter apodemus]|uniref:histidine kinase n=1 Tax=Helicobacter apodemus TaxID=135569 RepID=A0A2U8FBG4_9HELI|nr:ATP-binding protein [Helicobacter apodemus]AWI33504.1 two-component sensor histidine kinase [Helicobacter apodemus]